jgi:glycosyltransferase involved in cell wall biosynthesis
MIKNLLIDGQILQTNAWHRGMGKYTMQVMQELSKNAPKDVQLSVVFNTAMKDNLERFDVIKFLCPRIKQIFCELPTPDLKQTEAEEYRTQLAQTIDGAFPGQDNHYLITAPFYFDFYAEFPSNCHRLMLFYDLTPLLFWRDLGGYFPPDLYMARFARILEAETIFSISETTRRDLIKTFGLAPETVININGGFTKIADSALKPKELIVPPKYVLLPSGDLPHKNNEVAVKGFQEYCTRTKQRIPLFITSNFSQESKTRLQTLSENIVFTGNVPDEELEWLYEHATAVLFSSKYEGLGLPILDAAASNKPIIASRIAVFEEMSKEAFYFFDASSAGDLATQLHKALSSEGLTQKLKHYPAIMEKYTWTNTSQAITKHLTSAGEILPQQAKLSADKPRIAVVSLHPGIANQVGRCSESFYHVLSQEYIVDYYFDANGYHYREMERPSFLDFIGCNVFDISKLTLKSYTDYDAVVYIIDESAVPSRLAQRASVLPGIVLSALPASAMNDQQKLFMRLITNNALAVHAPTSHSYTAYTKLANLIQADLSKQDNSPNAASLIIRKGGLNSAIIQRLKAIRSYES